MILTALMPAIGMTQFVEHVTFVCGVNSPIPDLTNVGVLIMSIIKSYYCSSRTRRGLAQAEGLRLGSSFL
jgi:hypothetical protein